MSADNQDAPEGDAKLDQAAIELAGQVFDAARDGDVERLRAWFDQGLPPNLSNHKGDSLLMLASYHGRLEAVALLLERGADPDRHNDNGQSPLAGAAFKGNRAMAELLLDGGGGVDVAAADGKTALMFAAMFDHLELVELLLARGADPMARESRGMNAAELARAMGAERTATHLAAWG